MSVVSYNIDGGIAVVSIDNPPVNALGHAVRTGLAESMQRAKSDAAVTAIVVVCRGRTFSAGADITEFGTPAATRDPHLRDLLAAIEAVGKPVIAAIHGTALGGGLELAMACTWRVAVADAKVGLPEVNLGLIPGAGGTQRLPRLVGPVTAMEINTSGRHFDAQFALGCGLVDEVVAGDLQAGAVEFARRVVAEGRALRVTSRMDEKVRNVDPSVFANFRKSLERRARGLLAPWKCVDGVEIACRDSFEAGSKFEADAFAECLASPQRAALTHLFNAERRARKIPDVPASIAPQPIRKAAVIGAGTMGGGIAMNFANAGIAAVMIDVSAQALEKGLGVVRRNYATSVERGSTTQAQMDRALALISTATDYAALGDADIVIEAVFEEMSLKKDIFARMDAAAAPHAILGSNTSSLNIDEIATATRRPDKVIGTHFFSPANVMKLLENVRGAKTSPQTIATAMEMGKRIDKVCVLAGNCDGFIGNRMYQFYTGGCEYLLEEGATPEQIDRALENFGMAMGPLATRDMSGLDVGALVRKARRPTLPKEERLSNLLERIVDMGRLGQKTGAGFYKYEGRKRINDPLVLDMAAEEARNLGIVQRTFTDQEIVERLLLPLVNEGAKILEEGIALRASDIDVTYCHGYGFPKYYGGPMFWAERNGLQKIVTLMESLQQRFGPRYAPAPLVRRLAQSGQGWSSLES
ncbi:MAG: 3-hydroxyacyl-CoA dehydrogenase NAD-binding domain-containing protein [Gammaproteobacteria bacterium]